MLSGSPKLQGNNHLPFFAVFLPVKLNLTVFSSDLLSSFFLLGGALLEERFGLRFAGQGPQSCDLPRGQEPPAQDLPPWAFAVSSSESDESGPFRYHHNQASGWSLMVGPLRCRLSDRGQVPPVQRGCWPGRQYVSRFCSAWVSPATKASS